MRHLDPDPIGAIVFIKIRVKLMQKCCATLSSNCYHRSSVTNESRHVSYFTDLSYGHVPIFILRRATSPRLRSSDRPTRTSTIASPTTCCTPSSSMSASQACFIPPPPPSLILWTHYGISPISFEGLRYLRLLDQKSFDGEKLGYKIMKLIL